MKNLKNFLDEQLLDKEFKKTWEESEFVYDLARILVNARKMRHISQKELAVKAGVNQTVINKIETGNANPTLKILKRLAEGMDMVLRIEFVPKQVR